VQKCIISIFQHNSLQLIQHEWFRISSQKDVNGQLVEGYLNSIKEHFSNFLLERIVNLQDANVTSTFKFTKQTFCFSSISRETQHFIIVLPMVIGML